MTKVSSANRAKVMAAVLAWYGANRRDLPWRTAAGQTPDPYRVWLSEIMLQQTTAATVETHFSAFVRRWPSVHDLAASALEAVLEQWAGLGYYARARNLHACARQVVERYGGVFPADVGTLKTLAGIGEYTAAAIAAIAFDAPVVPVDGNIERIGARLFAIATPLPRGKRAITQAVQQLAPDKGAGDMAQALMDIGAMVCRPRQPVCAHCPLSPWCQAYQRGMAEKLPVKAARAPSPVRHGVVFWIERDDGRVLVRRRARRGLLGGMVEFPATRWDDKSAVTMPADAPGEAPLAAAWRRQAGVVEHTFTHFRLRLEIWRANVPAQTAPPGESYWVRIDDLDREALPTLMRKVAHAIAKQNKTKD